MSRIDLTLPVDAQLLDRARAEALDLTDVLETALAAALRARREAQMDAEARAFAEENAEAIRINQARYEREGLFGDEFRRW